MDRIIAVIVQLIFVAVFVVLGIVFFKGKGAFLIAGYNTSSREERAKYDEKALCRFMGKLMFACAGCFVLSALGNVLEQMALVWLGIILMLVICITAVIYANTGNRFKRK
ncbi:MAG: DUF3784 domain-containing protein [Oscillospiraceae bacterium]